MESKGKGRCALVQEEWRPRVRVRMLLESGEEGVE